MPAGFFGVFMKMKFSAVIRAALLVGFATAAVFADINISVDAKSGVKAISPHIFGRNIQGTYDIIQDTSYNLTSNEEKEIARINEAGIHMLRLNQGNNATKYNWRKHLSSHPDWINNVYDHNWDITAKKVLNYMPGVDGMYGFQLSGYVAKTKEANYHEWEWSQAHPSVPSSKFRDYDLAGGGEMDENGNLIKSGSWENYLEPWPSDSTVGILKYWRDELKYDMKRFQYWSMDNEPEIWAGGHNDMPKDYSSPAAVANAIVDSFIEVASKARKIYPEIKISGPVAANEWLWCNVSYFNSNTGKRESDRVTDGNGNKVCWLKYFIQKIGEAQKKTGLRLLDVMEIHWYPTETDYETLVNLHRVFYDTTYNYPGTNGMKGVNGNWDETVTKEYIFKRLDDWMKEYLGENHGVKFALTETEFLGDQMTNALIYASWLGTFADNGVEIFTPWVWKDGMYEVLHLFSRYGHANRVKSVSSNDSLVSAYSSFNGADSMTVIFVNRSAGNSQNVNLSIANFDAIPQAVPTYTLSGLSGETFVSHTSNALKKGTANIADNKLSITLPAKSITAVVLTAPAPEGLLQKQTKAAGGLYRNGNFWFVNNSAGNIAAVDVLNSLGQRVASMHAVAAGQIRLATDGLTAGQYVVRLHTNTGISTQKILLK